MRTPSRSRPTSHFRFSPLVVALAGALAGSAMAATYVVNTTSNATGPTTPIDCASGSTCSLHQALQAAVSACDTNATINFALPAAPFVISPSFALPAVSNNCPGVQTRVLIDGFSHPGAAPNAGATGFNIGAPIVISGSSYFGYGCALKTADFSYGDGILAIRGVDIRNFTYGSVPAVCGVVELAGNRIVNNSYGVDVKAPGRVGGPAPQERNVISGSASGTAINSFNGAVNIVNNYIGTDDSGSAPAPNGIGISVSNATGGTISNNVISGNTFVGVSLSQSPNVVISNNAIGTDVTRTAAIGNGDGLNINCSSGVQVTGNNISANTYGGLNFGGSDNVQVTSNKIGVANDGSTPMGNGIFGVKLAYGGCAPPLMVAKGVFLGSGSNSALLQNNVIVDNAEGVLVQDGSGNLITSNTIKANKIGVKIVAGTGNAILANSIYASGNKNIDLDFYGGPLPNDDEFSVPPSSPPDLDTGPNLRQNYPVIGQVTWVGADTHVQWTLRSTPLTTHNIEFYSNTSAGLPSGQIYHGPALAATTDASGFFGTTTIIAGGNHDNISLTATDPAGNTSEFSPAVALTPTPAVNVTRSPSAFATTEVGDTDGPMTITLTSSGTAPYQISAFDSSPSCSGGPICSSGAFTCAPSCLLTPYAPGSSCNIQTTFAPTVPGTQTTVFYVCDNAPGSPRPITLTGNAIAKPASTLLPASHDFGSVALGGFSGVQAFTVQNPAATPVTLSAFTTTGPFALQNNTCGATLAATASCGVEAKFVPAATGLATGILSLTAGSNVLNATLSGTGTSPPPATLSPPSINFGSVGIGFSSAVGTFTVNNPALVPVSLSPFTVTAPFVLQATTCTSSLAPSSTCTADVKFVPATTGAVSGQILVTAGGLPVSSGLVGTGAAAAALSITPSTHDFGTVLVGNNPSQTFTITNPSASSASLAGPTVTGRFEITSTTCGAILASTASCVANVRFVPPAQGTFGGQLSVTSSGTVTSATLVGSGLLQPVLEMPTDTMDLGSTTVGGTILTRVIQLRNIGNAALTIERIAVGTPFTLVNACPLNLLPGATCQLTISLDPTVLGSFNAALTVITNAPGGSRNVQVRGQVQARPEPVIRVNPQSIGFGDRLGNTTGDVTRRVDIVNDGGSAATGVTVSVNMPHFLFSTNCPAVLAPAQTCYADVTFQPIGYGPKQATLSVSSSAPTATVGLSGAGCRPPAASLSRAPRLNCAP